MGTKITQAALTLASVGLLAIAAGAGELDEAKAAFEQAFAGNDYQAKVAAIERLIATGEGEATRIVVERALVDEDQFVFERAVEVLKEKTDEQDRAYMAEQAVAHRKREIRVVLTRMLGSLDTPRAVDSIAGALKDPEWTVRAAAVRAARERRAKALVAPLIALVAADDGRVQRDAIEALFDLTGADYGRDAKKWAAWWASVEQGFVLKPPVIGSEAVNASEVATDVETVSREGLYEIRSKRTLFVVDVSASMDASTAKGSRLDITKRELKRVIEALGPDMLFNVLFFNDQAVLWKPRMVRASSGNQHAAVRVVERIKAAGTTATYEALKLAFTLDDVDTIYFLSDGFPTAGAVTSEELIKTEVRKWNRARGIAVHTIAFVAGQLKGETEDKERARAFMKELAGENWGITKLVE